MDVNTKIEIIKKWAVKFNQSKFDRRKQFNTAFVESIEEWITEYDITYAQENALDNIIEKFKIPCYR